LFCQDNCQKFLVLQVNPKIYQDNKTSLKHTETIGGWTPRVLLHWYEGWNRFTYVMHSKENKNKAKRYPPDRQKKKSQKGALHWRSSPPVNKVEMLVLLLPHGLRWPDWTCYFREAPLTTGWWDPAVYHEPCVNINNLGCDPSSTSEPWFLAKGFLTPHLIPTHIYLCSLVIFVSILTTEITEL
jgi:hypothetical protein